MVAGLSMWFFAGAFAFFIIFFIVAEWMTRK